MIAPNFPTRWIQSCKRLILTSTRSKASLTVTSAAANNQSGTRGLEEEAESDDTGNMLQNVTVTTKNSPADNVVPR
jgi:hypothetical protein